MFKLGKTPQPADLQPRNCRFNKSEMDFILSALNRSQAVIQFKTDGTIITANKNFLAAMGYTLEEVKDQHHSIFVEEAYKNSSEYKQFWESLNKGKFQSAEYKRIGKGGKEIWIQASYNPIMNAVGKVVKVVKYATDITQQTLQNADYKGQINAIGKSQAVISFKLDGTILDANDNFLNTVGYRLDEIQGQHHRMFVEQKDRESEEYTNFWASLRRGEFQTAEYKRLGKGGKEVWIQASYNPIFDPEGRPFKIVKFAADITPQVINRQKAAKVGEIVDENLGKILEAVVAVSNQSSSAAEASNETLQMVESVASASEEFQASVTEIARSMTASQDDVRKAIEEARTADDLTQKLTDQALSMDSVVSVIQDIAGQINLLALNATIESARAGEAGKGFAVVASEVKALANQVGSATEKISGEISGMQSICSSVVENLNSIRSAVESVEGSVTSVSGAVEEQTAASGEIASNIQTAASAVNAVNNNLDSISHAVGSVENSVTAVSTAVGEQTAVS
ncbi:methyl-accepting chemotaxis protein [Kiloniella majae]|uniref:methyl-accepting chemotaxis protein n=1 Tax=Kiloniella majae TaxID=1938558 RepID=UPI000A278245|nr:PAS domain-containing methyl-accepting chemotaxis protein [Kiloniella majae]